MYALKRRSQLPPGIAQDMEGLSSSIAAWASKGHDEEGENLDGVPIGARVGFVGAETPDRWLPCDGGEYSRTTYRALFRVIGVTNGAGDGTTTFNVPTVANTIIFAGV